MFLKNWEITNAYELLKVCLDGLGAKRWGLEWFGTIYENVGEECMHVSVDVCVSCTVYAAI